MANSTRSILFSSGHVFSRFDDGTCILVPNGGTRVYYRRADGQVLVQTKLFVTSEVQNKLKYVLEFQNENADQLIILDPKKLLMMDGVFASYEKLNPIRFNTPDLSGFSSYISRLESGDAILRSSDGYSSVTINSSKLYITIVYPLEIYRESCLDNETLQVRYFYRNITSTFSIFKCPARWKYSVLLLLSFMNPEGINSSWKNFLSMEYAYHKMENIILPSITIESPKFADDITESFLNFTDYFLYQDCNELLPHPLLVERIDISSVSKNVFIKNVKFFAMTFLDRNWILCLLPCDSSVLLSNSEFYVHIQVTGSSVHALSYSRPLVYINDNNSYDLMPILCHIKLLLSTDNTSIEENFISFKDILSASPFLFEIVSSISEVKLESTKSDHSVNAISRHIEEIHVPKVGVFTSYPEKCLVLFFDRTVIEKSKFSSVMRIFKRDGTELSIREKDFDFYPELLQYIKPLLEFEVWSMSSPEQRIALDQARLEKANLIENAIMGTRRMLAINKLKYSTDDDIITKLHNQKQKIKKLLQSN